MSVMCVCVCACVCVCIPSSRVVEDVTRSSADMPKKTKIKKNVPSSEVVDDVMRSSAAICASISCTLAPKGFAVLQRV